MSVLLGFAFGVVGWFLVRYVVFGIYTVDQNERAVKTVWGRAERLDGATTLDTPPTSVATTGSALMAASMATPGWPSLALRSTKTLAAAYSGVTSRTDPKR